MSTPVAKHGTTITVIPGPGIPPQISYYLRAMIGSVLRDAPMSIQSADARVIIDRDAPASQCCVVTADVDINDDAPIHVGTTGVFARQAVDLLEERLRSRLNDPRLIISPN